MNELALRKVNVDAVRWVVNIKSPPDTAGVMCQLAARADENGVVRCKMADLCDLFMCSTDSIGRMLRYLESVGFLQRHTKRGGPNQDQVLALQTSTDPRRITASIRACRTHADHPNRRTSAVVNRRESAVVELNHRAQLPRSTAAEARQLAETTALDHRKSAAVELRTPVNSVKREELNSPLTPVVRDNHRESAAVVAAPGGAPPPEPNGWRKLRKEDVDKLKAEFPTLPKVEERIEAALVGMHARWSSNPFIGVRNWLQSDADKLARSNGKAGRPPPRSAFADDEEDLSWSRNTLGAAPA